MSLETETILDRRRVRRQLSFWRVLAVVALTLAAGAFFMSGDGGVLDRRQIARVSLSGMITESRELLRLLDRIGEANHVAGVILYVNSPGGTTTGGEAIYEALRRLSEKKPVVAQFGTVAASAAYIAGLGTDHIVARGNSITGSVGVIFQWVNVIELLNTLGIEVEEVKSGPLKAVPSPFEPTDERARAVTEEMVEDAKVWFVDLVEKRRKISPSAVPGLTEGRIYSGRQAVDYKLVDQIGDERAALSWLSKERGVPVGLKVLQWTPKEESTGLFGWLLDSGGAILGLSGSKIAALLGEAKATLELDGLVSVWHPASN